MQTLPEHYTTRPYEKGWKGLVVIELSGGRRIPAQVLRDDLYHPGRSTSTDITPFSVLVLSKSITMPEIDNAAWFTADGTEGSVPGRLMIAEPALELWFVREKAKPGTWSYGPVATEQIAIDEMDLRYRGSTEDWRDKLRTVRMIEVRDAA